MRIVTTANGLWTYEGDPIMNQSSPVGRMQQLTNVGLPNLQRGRALHTIYAGQEVELRSDGTVRVAGAPESPPDPNTLVASYAKAHTGMTVGGGECSHLAVEALRAAGARFAWLGFTGRQKWGKELETLFSVRPGDILQYTNVVFANAEGHSYFPAHTAIVSDIDERGFPVRVIQQNFNGVRAAVEWNLNLDFDWMSGAIRAYRPQPRVDSTRVVRYSVVNRTPLAVTVQEQWGSYFGAVVHLDVSGSMQSYNVRTLSVAKLELSYPTPWLVLSGNRFPLEDGHAYAVVERNKTPWIIDISKE